MSCTDRKHLLPVLHRHLPEIERRIGALQPVGCGGCGWSFLPAVVCFCQKGLYPQHLQICSGVRQLRLYGLCAGACHFRGRSTIRLYAVLPACESGRIHLGRNHSDSRRNSKGQSAEETAQSHRICRGTGDAFRSFRAQRPPACLRDRHL